VKPGRLSALAILFLAAAVASSAGAVIKQKWAFIGGNTESQTVGFGVAVDIYGDFYAAGSQMYDATNADHYRALLVKVSNYHHYPEWSRTLNGTGASLYMDSFKSVAAVPDGSGVVAGGTYWSATLNRAQAMLAYYNDGGTIYRSGDLVWLATPDALSVEGVAVSGTSWVYVACIKQGAGSNTDLWVAKYSMGGVFQTDYTYPNPLGNDNGALAITLDSAGFVYVAGYVTVGTPGTPGYKCRNIYLNKFNENLGEAWGINSAFLHDGSSSSTDFAASVAVSPSGAIFLAGATTQASTIFQENLDAWVGRVDDTGAARVLAWSYTLDGGEEDNDSAAGVAVDSSGYVWVTGSLDTAGSHWTDFWLCKLSPAGSRIDSYLKDFSGNADDGGHGIAIASAGPVTNGFLTDMITSQTIYFAQFWEWFPSPSIPPDFINAYPNPFRPGSGGAQDGAEIVVRSLPAGCVVRFYTLSGVLVRELRDEDGDGKVSWDARNAAGKDAGSGVYIFAATASGSGTKKGKVVIIR
jgi:hypothetical protein